MLRNWQAFSSMAVDNVPKAREFYETKLGLEVREEDGMLYLHIVGSTPIMLYLKEGHTPATYTTLNFSVKHIELPLEYLSKGHNVSQRLESRERHKKI